MSQHLTKGEPYYYQDGHKLRIKPPRASANHLLATGDILFMSRGANNYAVLLQEFPNPAIAPLSFFIIRAKHNVVSGYLVWALNQEPVRARLNEMRTGAGTPMIPRQEFGKIVIPLPPKKTQQTIATILAYQAKERMFLRQLLLETERLHQQTSQLLLSQLDSDERN